MKQSNKKSDESTPSSTAVQPRTERKKHEKKHDPTSIKLHPNGNIKERKKQQKKMPPRKQARIKQNAQSFERVVSEAVRFVVSSLNLASIISTVLM